METTTTNMVSHETDVVGALFLPVVGLDELEEVGITTFLFNSHVSPKKPSLQTQVLYDMQEPALAQTLELLAGTP